MQAIYTPPLFAADTESLVESAAARIEKHRKGDVQLSLVGHDETPLAGATVRVRQVRHEFLFGGSVFPLVYELQKGNLKLPLGEGEPLQHFGRRYAELLNFATLPRNCGQLSAARDVPCSHEDTTRRNTAGAITRPCVNIVLPF